MRNEIRCGRCNKLLAKGEAIQLEIKCPRCGTMHQITKSGSKTAKR